MLWYYVAPFVDGKWNILFEDQPRPYIYDSEEEALKAAHKAAKAHAGKDSGGAGVRVKDGERWRQDGTYDAEE
jgi:hypothetical protein